MLAGLLLQPLSRVTAPILLLEKNPENSFFRWTWQTGSFVPYHQPLGWSVEQEFVSKRQILSFVLRICKCIGRTSTSRWKLSSHCLTFYKQIRIIWSLKPWQIILWGCTSVNQWRCDTFLFVSPWIQLSSNQDKNKVHLSLTEMWKATSKCAKVWQVTLIQVIVTVWTCARLLATMLFIGNVVGNLHLVWVCGFYFCLSSLDLNPNVHLSTLKMDGEPYHGGGAPYVWTEFQNL